MRPARGDLDLEAVPLHKQIGETKAGHDRNKEKVQLIRGDALFLGNAIDRHPRDRRRPQREDEPAQHCGYRPPEAMKKRREKEQRNDAPAKYWKILSV